MNRAVDEMKRSAYWEERASASLRHAIRHEVPAVIARRIEKLEAEKRGYERDITFDKYKMYDLQQTWMLNSLTTTRRAETDWTLSKMTAEEQAVCTAWVEERKAAIISRCARWIEHLDNRIAYERALLGEKGGLAADRKLLEVGGAALRRGAWLEIIRVSKRAGEIVSVTTKADPRYHWMKHEVIKIEDIQDIMTKTEYEEAGEPVIVPASKSGLTYSSEPKPWEALEEAAKNIQVVTADELFPTPEAVIERMLELVPMPKHSISVLEPSAGTGAIVKYLLRLPEADFHHYYLVEKNQQLRQHLKAEFGILDFVHVSDFSDFLEYPADDTYSRIYMNPPFSADAEHVMYAYDLLADSGIMVAVMSEHAFFASDNQSTAFRDWLEAVGGYSEQCPADSFKASGTGVNTRLVVIKR